VNSSKKAYISFLMSVFLMSGIAALAYIGVFDFFNFPAMPNFIKVVAIVAVFSALFLLFFLLINIKRCFSGKKKAAAADPAGVTRHQSGLLAAASRLPPPAGINETSRYNVIYEKNGVPYINSGLTKENNRENLDSNFFKLVESVTGRLAPPVPRQQDKPDKAHKGGQG